MKHKKKKRKDKDKSSAGSTEIKYDQPNHQFKPLAFCASEYEEGSVSNPRQFAVCNPLLHIQYYSMHTPGVKCCTGVCAFLMKAKVCYILIYTAPYLTDLLIYSGNS